jgi:hypothetical protein
MRLFVAIATVLLSCLTLGVANPARGDSSNSSNAEGDAVSETENATPVSSRDWVVETRAAARGEENPPGAEGKIQETHAEGFDSPPVDGRAVSAIAPTDAETGEVPNSDRESIVLEAIPNLPKIKTELAQTETPQPLEQPAPPEPETEQQPAAEPQVLVGELVIDGTNDPELLDVLEPDDPPRAPSSKKMSIRFSPRGSSPTSPSSPKTRPWGCASPLKSNPTPSSIASS